MKAKQLTEHDIAALLKNFGKQVNDGRKFTLDELLPILAYAAALIARQQDDIQLLAKTIQEMKVHTHPTATKPPPF